MATCIIGLAAALGQAALGAGAGTGAGTGAGAGAPAPSREAQAKPAGPAETPRVEPLSLPKSCFNPNGTFNQETIVAEQRNRAAVIGEKIGSQFVVSESAHYLIFSSAGPEETRLVAQWAEPLFTNLERMLGIDPREPTWDGKCTILLFAARREFLDYATRFDQVDAGRWQAYYYTESCVPPGPVLMHICLPVEGQGSRILQDLFAHEGTHTFFRVYKGHVRLPLWLDEGLADYMMIGNDPVLRPQKRAPAADVARSGKAIGAILDYPPETVLTPEEYSVSYTLVDFLLSTSGPRMKTFIESLKRRVPQNSAIQTSYGFDMDGLQTRWRAWMTTGAVAPKTR